jgi:signal transduction histidine kinase/FixJ family two-component response regulator
MDFYSYTTILVVDDSASVSALILEGLKDIVSEVRIVGTGKEAIEQLMYEPVTLVLLDHRLPDMTGIDVIKTLSHRGTTFPFIAITAHGDEKVAVEMMKLGAHDYLIKNGNFLDLLPSVVRQVLDSLESETRLKSTQKDLRESEQRFRRLYKEFQTLLDGIPDALSLMSPDLTIVWSNRGHAELFGKGDTGQGRHCYEVNRQADEPCEDCPAVITFQTGETQEVLRQFGGRTFGLKVFPLKDDHGKVVNVINLSSDITEKIRLREEAARSGRLASLGELAAGVAHEINTPNALILLNAPILEEIWSEAAPILEKKYRDEGDFPLGRLSYSRIRDEIPRLHSEVIDAAHRIRVIVEDLKEFVNQEDAEGKEDLDLNEIVRKAVRLIANVIINSTSRVHVSYGEGLPTVRGIFGRIEQVVVNLLLNACQALPKTECGIFVSTRFDDRRNRTVLEIRDEGVGIGPEDLSRLTDPFYTTRRQSGGTGLGLSVSARIVKEHCVELNFSSVPGEGTVVTLKLPVSS